MSKKDKRKYLSLLIVLFLSGCASVKKSEISSTGSDEPVDRRLIHGNEEVSIDRKAVIIKGVFKGLKNSNYIDVDNCTFTYSKGLAINHENQEYKYQMISVLLAGKDQRGVSVFERFMYSNVNHSQEFHEWDYSKSFGPVKLDSSMLFGFDNKDAVMTFIKDSTFSEIKFKHNDLYGTTKSKFFKEGENREYRVRLIFDQFDNKHINLNKIIVNVDSSMDLGMGKFSDPTPIMSAECSRFKDLEE